jgi:hypothetical protein
MSAKPKSLSSPQRENSIERQADAQGSHTTQPPAPQNPDSPPRETPLDVETARRPTSVERPADASETISSEEEVTRAVTRAQTHLSLRDVKSVFVEVIENEHANQILREVLVKNLQASNRFNLSKSRDDADAVLKVRTRGLQPGTGNSSQSVRSVFTVQLINAQGQIIWPLKGRSSHGTYSSPTAEQVGVQILRDMLADYDQQKSRH